MIEVLACPECGCSFTSAESCGVPTARCGPCEQLWILTEDLETRLAKIARTFRPADLQELRDKGQERREQSVQSVLHGEQIQYYGCPLCDVPMTRTNFGVVSGILIHECSAHGYLVGESDLPIMIDFIERGGEVAALERERDELAERLAALQRRAKDEKLQSRRKRR